MNKMENPWAATQGPIKMNNYPDYTVPTKPRNYPVALAYGKQPRKTAHDVAHDFNLKKVAGKYRGDCPICQAYKLELEVWSKPEGFGCHCFYGCDGKELFRVLLGKDYNPFSPSPNPVFIRQKEEDEAQKRQWACQIWNESRSSKDTLADAYLKSRGITPFPLSDSIRFHSRLKHTIAGQYLPALVARVDDPAGELCAIQRIYLQEPGIKSDIDPVKMTLGTFKGGAIRLGMPGDTLCLAEGLETALSAQQMTGIATWATVSAGNMKNIIPPPSVKTVYLMADNDPAGIRAANEAGELLTRSGLTVLINMPEAPGTDWNDHLMKASA